MTAVNGPQLSTLVCSSSPAALLEEVKKFFVHHYPAPEFQTVERHFGLVENLFNGRFPGYRPCNTEYHDFSHTIDTFLAVMRISDGFNLTGGPLPVSTVVRLLVSALYHDAGYIQKSWDTLGTGAKYTREHVTRSKEFIAENAGALDLTSQDLEVIGGFIDSTGFSPDFKLEADAPLGDKTAAALLGAADLIAQMADRLYLEKLLFLYYEFREAGIEGYETEFDIIRKTIAFYEKVRERLECEYGGVHRYVTRHFETRFGIARDLYSEVIEKNMAYVRAIIADTGTNFRTKLKRVPD